MKILHLFSDWKWTGPAEPTVILCEALQRRGHRVTFAHRCPPVEVEDSIGKRIAERSFHGTDQFSLQPLKKIHRGFALTNNVRDLKALRQFIDQEGFDIINVHHSHDHILGGLAARFSKKKPVVIRSDHKRDAIVPSWGNRLLVSRLTDGMVTFSDVARQRDIMNLPIPSERIGKVGVALQLERYDPGRPFQDMRSIFKIGPEHLVIGMVARFQKYRRTDAFLAALARLVKEFPQIRALLVGRSGQIRESVIEPTKRMGLDGNVVLAGYQTAYYLDTLATMDIFVFLMPGSDGTARALREAMAMGKPAVVAKRGMLPELVEDGKTGFIGDDTPENLYRMLKPLIQDRHLREQMGKAAFEKAHRDFSLEKQAEAMEAFYRRILEMGRRTD